MPDPQPTPYDHVAYPTLPAAQTHPDRLATIARLFGLTPQPVGRCRVLELGCGNGMNLIPMAHGLPGSEFVGIDLAPTAVAAGQALIAALKLSNITLHQLDLMDVAGDGDTFDYVIAHGVYSWVPEAVRDRLLAICRARLAPHGVAFVSYNAYPGSHLRQAVRRVLQFHLEGIADAREAIAQARALARFIADSPPRWEDDDLALRQEMRAMLGHSPGAVFHDELSPDNVPLYFHEFVAHARRHRLQFLAEANVHDMQERSYPPETAEQIRTLARGDVLLKEQYLDFLKNRRFRQTLLCRAELTIDRRLRADAVREMYVAAQVRPSAEHPDLASPRMVEAFTGPRGSSVSTDGPLAKAALVHLGEVWPCAVAFDDLVRAARRRLDRADHADVGETSALLDMLATIYAAGVIELGTSPSRFVLQAGARPAVSPVARAQLESGSVVATLRHGSIEVSDHLARTLLRLMDGTRTREDLRTAMNAHVADRGEVTAEEIDAKIAEVARLALLVE